MNHFTHTKKVKPILVKAVDLSKIKSQISSIEKLMLEFNLEIKSN